MENLVSAFQCAKSVCIQVKCTYHFIKLSTEYLERFELISHLYALKACFHKNINQVVG